MTVHAVPEEIAAMNARGELVANILIGLIILCWLLFGMIQAHRGHGYGSFFQRFLQNTFSCCAVEPEGDVEKAAEMTSIESGVSRATTRIGEGMDGEEIGVGDK